MVPLDRALVSSYRLSILTMSLSAAVWPQFATQVFPRGIRRLTCIGSYEVTTFTFRAQATTCSKHHTRTAMDAGCKCVCNEYGRLTLATAGQSCCCRCSSDNFGSRLLPLREAVERRRRCSEHCWTVRRPVEVASRDSE